MRSWLFVHRRNRRPCSEPILMIRALYVSVKHFMVYSLYHAPRKWWQLKGDKCAFILMDKENPEKLVWVAGIHLDDFLIGSDSSSTIFTESEAALLETFRWKKWQEESFGFAGVNIRQNSYYSIFLDQESYTQKWLDEINIDKIQSRSAPLQPSEISELRGALGTMPCRATQSGPQFLAETSLRLSEISRGTVETPYKSTRETSWSEKSSMRQRLDCFFHWLADLWALCCGLGWRLSTQPPWQEQHSGHLYSSCMDLEKSWMAIKRSLRLFSSALEEVQAITIGEDQNVHIGCCLLNSLG